VDEISTSNAADEAAEIMGIACKLGLEGIIAKRPDAPNRSAVNFGCS